MNVQTLADAVSDLGLLTLRFGQVPRKTYYPDGVTPESDTDHTVMLGLIACGLADRFYPGLLDAGLVAQFALVHDLPEVHVGDTGTLRLPTSAMAEAKKRAEAEASALISAQFQPELPWVGWTLDTYERQELLAARFVRLVDKMLPKLLHVANGCVSPIEQGMTPDELEARYEAQYAELLGYGSDFPEMLDLYQELVRRELATFREVVAAR